MNTQLVQTYLIKEECCFCGVIFGIEQNHQKELLKTHQDFYCPNGHKQHYIAETEAERLKRELTIERQQHDQTKAELEHTKYQRRANKGVLTKLKARVKNGVCPCCNRSFTDLNRHMKTKHPNY